MWTPAPLQRTLAAALRDLGSSTVDARLGAIRDLLVYIDHPNGITLEDATSRLLEILARDDAANVRAAAASALGEIEAKEGVDGLLAALSDRDAFVEQMSVLALGEIGDRRALPAIRTRLTSDKAAVRYQAIVAFAAMADGESVHEALRDSLCDEDASIRYISLRLIEERIDKTLSCKVDRATWAPLLDAYAEAISNLPASTASSKPSMGPAGSTPSLSNDEQVAFAIVRAKLGDRSCEPVLLSVIEGRLESSSEDESAVFDLVGELELTAWIPKLETIAFGVLSPFRAAERKGLALATLARFGHPKAIAAIEALLNSFRPTRRTEGAFLAGKGHLVSLKEVIAELHGIDENVRVETLRMLSTAKRTRTWC